MRISGTVKWFSPTIGFGYIRPSNGGRDLLISGATVMKAGFSNLDVGQEVYFDIGGTGERQSAVNLETPLMMQF